MNTHERTGMAMQDSSITRFLVVEDELMIAMLLEDYLDELGFSAAWQADNILDALKIIEENTGINGAILDMNIRGQPIRPVADALARRCIPFCFITGYGQGAVTDHPEAPIISKPFDLATVQAVVGELVSRPGQGPGQG